MSQSEKISIALLILSDRVSRGERADGVEEKIEFFLKERGNKLKHVEVIPDEKELISEKLIEWADSRLYDLVLTSGGTGISPRDVTPEATLPLLDREIPGIPEAMRAESLKITDRAVLSRGYAGIRKETMIVNLPGSPKAAVENLGAVFNALIHGIAKAQGDPSDCDPASAKAGHNS